MIKNGCYLLFHFVQANQRAVTFSLLAIISFMVITANALFNQTGIHPQPLWNTRDYQATGMVAGSQFRSQNTSMHLRKTKTMRFATGTIPVPIMRPGAGDFSEPSGKLTGEAILVDTATVQRLLQKLGFYKGSIDGLDGPQTELAVKRFEKSKYLPERGEITTSLLLLLESAVERVAGRDLNAGNIKSAGQMKLDAIVRGAKIDPKQGQIEATQIAKVDPATITRIQVGLINYGDRDVNIDGVMGNRTKAAIERFQQRFNLEIDGVPSDTLIRKLESVGALTRG